MLVLGDALGHVQAFTALNGRPVFSRQTNGAVHAAASLGDANGDGWCDVLVSSGDHNVYSYGRGGELHWTFATERRLIYPPTLTDLDLDGQTDLLFCGSDSTLRCVTLNGFYDSGMMPWPMRGQNPALTNALPARAPFAARAMEEKSLLVNGDFEEGKVAEGLAVPEKESEVYRRRIQQPKGWMVETTYTDRGPLGAVASGVPLDGWRRAEGDAFEGTRALRVDTALGIASEPVAVPQELRAPWPHSMVRAAVLSKGAGAKAALLRVLPTGTTFALSRGVDGDGWTPWMAQEVLPPDSQQVQLVLETGEGGALWDTAQITVTLRPPAELKVLVNQVGYDLGAPKHFVVQGNMEDGPGTFRVKRDGAPVFEATLEQAGRIRGAYGQDWGWQYWRGDFTALGEAGEYVIEVRIGDASATSYPFRIGERVLWSETAAPAFRFFYYQRCGMAIPGIHGACHLDDAIGPDGKQYELWGGWHDAGDYNTYDNAPYVHGLSRSYQRMKPQFDAFGTDSVSGTNFLGEILWGAEHTRRMIAPDGSAYGHITSGYGFWAAPELETDNQPGTGDERPVRGSLTGNNPSHDHAAMAKMALWAPDKAPWVEPAARGLQWALEHGMRGPEQFSTTVDLFEATGDAKWAALAKELLPAPAANAVVVDALENYDRLFGEDHRAALRDALTAKANELVGLSNNPFGVLTFGTREQPNYFKTPKDQAGWHVGTTMYLFEAVELVALAYRHNPEPRYLDFVYNQFNWTLGMNPFNLSMMEGCGDAFLPTYHNRHTFGGVERGAIFGGISNGVTWRGVGDDSPYVDLGGSDIPAYEPNEFWLPHNTNYLAALTALQAARP